MISVVLATFNEEKNLPLCLQAIKPLKAEIVVVDGNSTDNTRTLAKEFGAKVIKTTNKANFHINKQMAIDAATGELILQLDADEIVDAELLEFIKQTHTRLLDANDASHKWEGPAAWWIQRKNFFLGRFLTKGGQYPDPVIRLFLKGKAKLPQKDVHEQMKVSGEVSLAEGHLLHYSNPTFADYMRKFNTYTSFAATHFAEKKVLLNPFAVFEYFAIKPLQTFFSLYFRHKGFVDGVPGFVFALMSSLHHPVAYLKYWELSKTADPRTLPKSNQKQA